MQGCACLIFGSLLVLLKYDDLASHLSGHNIDVNFPHIGIVMMKAQEWSTAVMLLCCKVQKHSIRVLSSEGGNTRTLLRTQIWATSSPPSLLSDWMRACRRPFQESWFWCSPPWLHLARWQIERAVCGSMVVAAVSEINELAVRRTASSCFSSHSVNFIFLQCTCSLMFIK